MPEVPSTKPKTYRRRGKGRPGEQSTVGKDALIQAAIDLLRTRSVVGLTAVEIAKHAQVDPNLIRYYFDDLGGLLTACTAKMMADRQEAVRELMSQRGTAEERLLQRVSTSLRLQRQDPNFHRLVVDWLFSHDSAEARDILERTASRGLGLTVNFLHAGESAGELRKVDPRFLNIALIGMFEFFVSAQPLVETLFGRTVDDELTDAFGEFVVDLILNGLRIHPVTPAAD